MLEGKDFVILTIMEVNVLYSALEKAIGPKSYKQMQELGILELCESMRTFLEQK
jgi:hypothetical protein